MAEVVLFDVKDHVATITMNRPEKLNAMNREVMRGIHQAWLRFRDDRNLWVAVITGAGDRAFSAGADLVAMAGRKPYDFAEDHLYPPPDGGLAVELWKPVIAAVNGYCFAAALNLLTSMTDIRIASEDATFSYAEVRRGVSGAGQAIAHLVRQVPYAIAMKWLLTGEVFDAQAALRYGLVNEVVPRARLMDRAQEVAQQITELPPVALRALKEAAIRGLSMDLPNAVRFAGTVGVLTRFTEDAQEGPRAFAEKRQAIWKGR